MVNSALRTRVGLAVASLPLKRVGVSGSPRIFRNLVPLGRGCIVFWGEQGPDETETLSSLAGN